LTARATLSKRNERQALTPIARSIGCWRPCQSASVVKAAAFSFSFLRPGEGENTGDQRVSARLVPFLLLVALSPDTIGGAYARN
jgi:hypothetical protein